MTTWAGNDRMASPSEWGFDRTKFTDGIAPPIRFCHICGKSTRGGHMGKREPMMASLCWDHSQGAQEAKRSRQNQALTDWERISILRKQEAQQAEKDRKAGIMYRWDKKPLVYGESGMRRVSLPIT